MRLQGGTFPFGEGPYPSHPSPLATQERTDEEKMDEWAEDQGSQEITDEMNIEHRLEIGQAPAGKPSLNHHQTTFCK